MRKAWLYVLGALALWVTQGGCRSEEEGTTRTQTLEIFSWWTQGSDKEALDQVIADHEETYSRVDVVNAALQAEKDGKDPKSELVDRMTNGSPPDTFQQTGALTAWLGRGSGLEPLDQRPGDPLSGGPAGPGQEVLRDVRGDAAGGLRGGRHAPFIRQYEWMRNRSRRPWPRAAYPAPATRTASARSSFFS